MNSMVSGPASFALPTRAACHIRAFLSHLEKAGKLASKVKILQEYPDSAHRKGIVKRCLRRGLLRKIGTEFCTCLHIEDQLLFEPGAVIFALA